MKFRTEIEPIRGKFPIGHSDAVLMLGSCFTDEVGQRLAMDGFNVLANPLGPIYNPAMIARTLARAIGQKPFEPSELVDGPRGCHCLDYSTRYSGTETDVLAQLRTDFGHLESQLRHRPVVILTFGSAYVYQYRGHIIGNCHKFPASEFERRRLSVGEVVQHLAPVLAELLGVGCRIILTVSPIRHLADGLHGNTLSKATLQLAVADLCERFPEIQYFPAYEIMIDDLRDYRFYAADMKHPSEVAVDYIYDIFCNTFMNSETIAAAGQARREFRHSQHRSIL